VNPARKRKLMFVLFILFGVTIAVSLSLYALRQNINLFYTPSQIVSGEVPKAHLFRLGGLVKKGSVERSKKDLNIQFVITDTVNNVTIAYNGILPDLFREGQGIVAKGRLNERGVFMADEILAKHDENYMPPEVKYSLDQVKK